METILKAQNATPQTEEALIAWMQANALPLDHVEAGNGFADLQPLKQILKDVKVVGLGEATHGTREFFQMKHRLVEFLVTEMGFTHFIIEGNYSACQPLNNYILHGEGDSATALTTQWYVVWDTQEIDAMVEWMRGYNLEAEEKKKISWQGVDIRQNGYGRKFILEYLARVAPERVAATATLFEALAIEEAKAPLGVDDAAQAILLQLAPQLQELVDFLATHQQELAEPSSPPQALQALRFGRVMQQWLITQVAALRPAGWTQGGRANYMGENLLELIEASEPGAKFMVWAYNEHLSSSTPDGVGPTIGSKMRERFRERYYAIGFEFNQGSFQNRILLPSQYFGDLIEVTLPLSPPHTLGWHLAQVNQKLFFLDFRTAAGNPQVAAWLDQSQRMHNGGWVFDPNDEEQLQAEPLTGYDAFIFVESTTASRPTPNALRRVALQEGL